jgi:hypothetical protein
LAEQGDLNGEVALLDHLALPDRLQKLGPSDHLAAGIGENRKYRGAPAADRDRTAISLQDHARPVKREGAETG